MTKKSLIQNKSENSASLKPALLTQELSKKKRKAEHCINCDNEIPERNLDLKPFCCLACREMYGNLSKAEKEDKMDTLIATYLHWLINNDERWVIPQPASFVKIIDMGKEGTYNIKISKVESEIKHEVLYH